MSSIISIATDPSQTHAVVCSWICCFVVINFL